MHQISILSVPMKVEHMLTVQLWDELSGLTNIPLSCKLVLSCFKQYVFDDDGDGCLKSSVFGGLNGLFNNK